MDTQVGGPSLIEQMKRDHRNMLIDSGDIISMDKAAKRASLGMRLAVTPTFFNHFYPYAEDAVKGLTFDDIMWDIIKIFKKEYHGEVVRNGTTFPIVSKTYVKSAESHDKVETFTDGKARDKYTTVGVLMMTDENLKPSLVFTIEDYKFTGAT